MSDFEQTKVTGFDELNPASKDNPLPGTLTDQASGHPNHVSHFGSVKVGSTKPIAFGNFPDQSKVETLWAETLTGTGNVTFQKGVGDIATGASASSSAQYISKKSGRFIAGQITVYQSGVHPVGAAVAGNVREWGLLSKDGNNGLFFRFDSTGFYVVAKNDGTETTVEAANFSNQPGYSVADQNRTWRIEYSAGRALFYDSAQGRKRLLHEMVDSAFPLTRDLNLRGYLKNENTTNSTDVVLRVRGFSISIWGEVEQNDIFFTRNSLDNGTLPSGAPYVPTATPDPSPPANVIDSGYLPRNEAEALFNHVQANTSLKVWVIDSNDEAGTVTQGTGSTPTITTFPGFPATVKASLFKDYARIVISNESGTDATNYFFGARYQDTDDHSVLLSIDQPIFGFFPAPLYQSVQKAKNPDGVYVAQVAAGGVSNASSTTPLNGAGPVTGATMDFTTDEWTSTAHGLSVGDAVVFDTSGSLPLTEDSPGQLQVGIPYWVSAVPTADTFKIARNPGTDDHINHTDNGTGSHTYRHHDHFESPWIPLDGHVSFVALANSDQASATQGIGLTFSPNALDANGQPVSTPGITRTPRFTFTQALADEDTSFIHMGPANQEKYAKVHYVNGINAQNDFHLVYSLAPVSSQLPVVRNDAELTPEVLATVGMSFIQTFDQNDAHQQIRSTTTGGKAGLNVHLVGGETAIAPKAGSNATTTPHVLTAGAATEIFPAESVPCYVEVANMGDIHAFVKPNDPGVTQTSGRPHFLGGSSQWFLAPGETLWGIAEDIGSATNTQNLSDAGNTAGGTATLPVNARTSDDLRATQDAIGETVTMEGFTFTHTPGYTDIDQVFLVKEGRTTSGLNQTVTHLESVGTTKVGTANITSPSIGAYANALYIAVVGNGASAKAVNSVSGLGLSWTKLHGLISSTNKSAISAWYAYGSPASAGPVTANFASGVGVSAITVHAYDNADPTTPIQASTVKEAVSNGENNWSLGPVTGTASGGLFFGAINSFDAVSTETTTNLTDQRGGTQDVQNGSDHAHIKAWDGAANASNTFTGNHGGSTPDWTAVALTIKPALAEDPTETLSYELSAVPGATSGSLAWTEATDAIKKVDITADRAWVEADIQNIKAISTMDSYDGKPIETDVLYVEVVESTGGTTRVAVSKVEVSP